MQQHVSVGPESIGFRLTEDALCFGGQKCTLTDVAIAAGVAPASIARVPKVLESISASVVYSAMRGIQRKLETAIDTMKVIYHCSKARHQDINFVRKYRHFENAIFVICRQISIMFSLAPHTMFKSL